MKFPQRRKKAEQPAPPQNHALARSQLGHDLGRILAQGEGQRYLARLIAVSGALAPSYSPAGPQATAYNEGLRRLGLFILAEVEEHCPDILPRLLLLALSQSGSQSGNQAASLQ